MEDERIVREEQRRFRREFHLEFVGKEFSIRNEISSREMNK